MPRSYARTLAQVIDDTLRLCGDFREEEANGRKFTRAEVKARVNEVLLDLAREEGLLREVRTIPLEADTYVYTLPGDCLRPLRIGLHGIDGYVIQPTSVAQADFYGRAMNADGTPHSFFRDTLTMNQIGVYPTPENAGSTSTTKSGYDDEGLLRQVQDEDGNRLPYDANRALRRVRGAPFLRRGRGRIIRQVISTYGNLQVIYLRSPERWTDETKYPDSGIPEFLHKDLKYAVANVLLRTSKKRVHKTKRARFHVKWRGAISLARSYGLMPISEATPL